MHAEIQTMEQKEHKTKLDRFIDKVNAAISQDGHADVLLMSEPSSIFICRLTSFSEAAQEWGGEIYRYQPTFGGAFSVEKVLTLFHIENYVANEGDTAVVDTSGIVFEAFENYVQSKQAHLLTNIDAINRFMQEKKNKSHMPLEYSIKEVKDIYGRPLAFPVIRLNIGQNVLWVSGTVYTDKALSASVSPIDLVKDLNTLTQKTPLNQASLNGNYKLQQAIEMVSNGTII